MQVTKTAKVKTVEPFYFGTAGSLFGCYHAPQGAKRRDSGVVLCNPMGFEYIRAHRAYRQLAIRLSHAGFPVLRFDYYGCGDSGGRSEEGEIGRWQEDISSAIDEIKERAGLERVCLIGMRLIWEST